MRRCLHNSPRRLWGSLRTPLWGRGRRCLCHVIRTKMAAPMGTGSGSGSTEAPPGSYDGGGVWGYVRL